MTAGQLINYLTLQMYCMSEELKWPESLKQHTVNSA